MVRICFAAAFGFFAALANYGQGADIDPTWFERAKFEGRAAHATYLALIKQTEEACETRFEYDVPSDPAQQKPKTIRFRAAAVNGCQLFERIDVHDIDTKTTAELECANADYQFQLRKTGLGKPFALTKYEPITLGQVARIPAPFGQMAYTELGRLLDVIDGKERSTLKALRWDEAQHLLYVRLEYNSSPPPSVFMVDMDAWLDPANHWRSVKVNLKGARIHNQIMLKYGPPVDGLAFPSEIIDAALPVGNNAERPFHVRIAMTVRKTTLSPADFRLAAFGLPEPAGVAPPKRSLTYLWLILAAVGCVVVAAAFRYLARRDRVRQTA